MMLTLTSSLKSKGSSEAMDVRPAAGGWNQLNQEEVTSMFPAKEIWSALALSSFGG